MNVEELKAKDAACYDAVFALGEKAGREKQSAMVSGHLRLAAKCGAGIPQYNDCNTLSRQSSRLLHRCCLWRRNIIQIFDIYLHFFKCAVFVFNCSPQF